MASIESGRFPYAPRGYEPSRNLGGGADWATHTAHLNPPPQYEGGGDMEQPPVITESQPGAAAVNQGDYPREPAPPQPQFDFGNADFVAIINGRGIGRFMGHELNLNESEQAALKLLLGSVVARQLDAERERIAAAVLPQMQAVSPNTNPQLVPHLPGSSPQSDAPGSGAAPIEGDVQRMYAGTGDAGLEARGAVSFPEANKVSTTFDARRFGIVGTDFAST